MLSLSPEFLRAATEQSWQHPCTLQWGQHLLGWCQETHLLGTSRPLLLCLCPFLTGGPTPEAAGGSQSWGRSLCGSAQSELQRRGTYLHRSLRKRGQELQTDWFPLHSEPVLCLEKGERFAIVPAGLMVGVIVLEQRWKLALGMGKEVCVALQSSPGAVPLVREHGAFTGWGEKSHNCVPRSMVACLSLAVSLTAHPYPSCPACHPLCPCLLMCGFGSDVLAGKVSRVHAWRPCCGKQPWQVTYYRRAWKLGISEAQCSGLLTAVTGTLLVFHKLFFLLCLGQKCFLRVLTAAQTFLEVCEENGRYH